MPCTLVQVGAHRLIRYDDDGITSAGEWRSHGSWNIAGLLTRRYFMTRASLRRVETRRYCNHPPYGPCYSILFMADRVMEKICELPQECKREDNSPDPDV
jgi:hypothetical protein